MTPDPNERIADRPTNTDAAAGVAEGVAGASADAAADVAERVAGDAHTERSAEAAGESPGASTEQGGDSRFDSPTGPPAGAPNSAASGPAAGARPAGEAGASAEQPGGPPVATATEAAAAADEAAGEEVEPRRRITSLEVLCVVLLLALIGQGWLASVLDLPAMRTGATVFVAVCVQALPFLVLGVLVSGAIAAFVSADALRRVLPRRTALAVPAAGLAGVALPNCECAAVPVARRLIQQDVPAAVAVTFLLAAPAVNPVVMVATAVAFPGEPAMVLARFAGSMATAIVMGLLWSRFGRMEWFAERAMRRIPARDGRSRWAVFAESARQDLIDAGGFLVLGGLTAAVMNVVVPRTWFDTLADQVLLGILVMAVLAVVLALCSEADAFVVASLSALPLLPRLVFLVVGPAIDIKLFALQAGTLGRRFAWRFAPLTFVVAIGCAVGAGVVFL